jgi:ergothioneine biosynthesis protein EgtB
VRQTTLGLCDGLTPEDQMVQSMPDASPTKWHLAHTTWFFETFLLKPNLAGYRLFHDNFTYLFNSYYKQVGSHPNRSFRGLFSRPSLDEVHAYREYVDRHMARLIENASENTLSLIVLGLNHEQQHQELIVTDIKHALWSNPLRPAWKHNPPNAETEIPPLEWIEFEEGLYTVGTDPLCHSKAEPRNAYGDVDFSFDNESPRHQVFLNCFSLASRLVTNADYIEFMRDGG